MATTKTTTKNKATNNPTNTPQFAPIGVNLRVPNIEEAARFYERIGFTQVMALPGPDGKWAFCMLNFGNSVIMLGPREQPNYPDKARERQHQKGPYSLGISLYLNVPDLASAYRACKNNGCKIVIEPMDEFWGDRSFTCVDPYGYEWQIAQTMRQLTPAEMAEAAEKAWSNA